MPGFEWREQTKKSRVRGETYLECLKSNIMDSSDQTGLFCQRHRLSRANSVFSCRTHHTQRSLEPSSPPCLDTIPSFAPPDRISFVSSSLSGSSKLRIWCLRDSPYIKIYIPMRSIIHGLYLIYSRPDSNPNLVDTRWFTAKRLYEILNLRQPPP